MRGLFLIKRYGSWKTSSADKDIGLRFFLCPSLTKTNNDMPIVKKYLTGLFSGFWEINIKSVFVCFIFGAQIPVQVCPRITRIITNYSNLVKIAGWTIVPVQKKRKSHVVAGFLMLMCPLRLARGGLWGGLRIKN